MSGESGRRGRPEEFIEKMRAELEILARTQMGPALRQKISPDDVVQEAMLKATLGWDGFLGDPNECGQLSAWLRTIVIHEVREAYRRFSTQGRDMNRELSLLSDPNRSCDGIDAYVQSKEEDPRDAVMRSERFEKLRDALRRLPPDQELAVVARYLNQMKIKEIADFLDMSEKMVSDRIYKGLAMLLDSMGDDDYWASRVA